MLQVDIDQLVIVGWAGRDHHAIGHHIEELSAIGVPRPSAVRSPQPTRAPPP